MAPMLLALFAAVTALLVVGAEAPPPSTLPEGAGEPWLDILGLLHLPDIEDELSDDDIMSGEELPAGANRCDICKSVVKKLQGIAVNRKRKAATACLINRICNKMLFGRRMCSKLLNHALTRIMDALGRDENPTRICTHLRWCQRQL